MNDLCTIIELLFIIKIRPRMYLQKKSIYSLIDYVSWYQTWVFRFNINDEDIKRDEHLKFKDYIIENTVWFDYANKNRLLSHDCLLFKTNWDEEKAFDMFYDLLDKFIEKEWIKVDINRFYNKELSKI